MNSIFVIQPFKKYGTWVFNDESRNLVEEPFVVGIPEIINKIINDNDCNKFTLIFSDIEMPKYDLLLEKDNSRINIVGTWYKCEKLKKTGWLCPALNIYFPRSPEKIYLKIQK